jgi:hypothetical protein
MRHEGVVFEALVLARKRNRRVSFRREHDPVQAPSETTPFQTGGTRHRMEGMPAPRWSRSRFSFPSVLLLWLVTVIGVDCLLRQRPILKVGTLVLLWAAIMAYCVWFEGWRTFLRVGLPWSVISIVGVKLMDWRFFGGIGGFLLLSLILTAAVFLWDLLMRSVGFGDSEKRPAPQAISAQRGETTSPDE